MGIALRGLLLRTHPRKLDSGLLSELHCRRSLCIQITYLFIFHIFRFQAEDDLKAHTELEVPASNDEAGTAKSAAVRRF